jgi:hypothetical protein
LPDDVEAEEAVAKQRALLTTWRQQRR